MNTKLFDRAFALFSGHGPLLAVLALLAASGAGYWAGDHNRNNAWLAKQAKVEAAAHQAYVAEAQRSDTAARSFEQEYSALANKFSTLEESFNVIKLRTPLVVYRAGRARPAAPAAVVGLATPDAHAQPEQPAATHGTAPPGGPVDLAGVGADADLSLSLGAVWLWNSALAGRSTAAGACGAAGAAADACAADAGLALADAWANHAANARTCALDRLRHQRLIDYITDYNNGQAKP
jgi:hypothetical protein